MSGFNLPPGVSQLPGEEETWQERFYESEEFLALDKVQQDCFVEGDDQPLISALFSWAYSLGFNDGAMAESQAGALKADPEFE